MRSTPAPLPATPRFRNRPPLPMSFRAPFIALSSLLPLALLAQGSLTPPGPPAPSMKSLAEIDDRISDIVTTSTKILDKTESRTAIDTLPGNRDYLHTITASGSYYLRGNLTGLSGMSGLYIAAQNVTIDLNGYLLDGNATGAATTGIALAPGSRNIVIRHGQLASWGAAGINGFGVRSIVLEDLFISGCATGITCDSAIVRRSSVSNTTGDGIFADTVESCQVANGAATMGSPRGISARLVRDSSVTGWSNTGSIAIGITGFLIEHCEVINVSAAYTAYGINLLDTTTGGSVARCTVANIASTGYQAVGINASTVAHSTVRTVSSRTGATGITATTAAHTDVQAVSSAGSGPATGINSTTATGCRADSITAGGIAYGIRTVAGTQCRVSNLRGTSCFGLSGDNFSDSSVASLTATTSNATGITGETIRGCRVEALAAANGGIGITATSVTDSAVATITANTGSTGTSRGIQAKTVANSTVDNCDFGLSANARGIDASVVQSCFVRNLSLNSNTALVGIAGHTISRCTVQKVLNASGWEYGISLAPLDGNGAFSESGMVEGCTVAGCPSGILANDGGRIVGNYCYSDTGGVYGIATYGQGSVVTDNQTRGFLYGYNINANGGLLVRNTSISDTNAFSFSGTVRVGTILTGGGAANDALANWDL